LEQALGSLDLVGPARKSGGDLAVPNPASHAGTYQESVLLNIDGVGFHFNDKSLRKHYDSIQSIRRFKRRKRKEEVREHVPARKQSVDEFPVGEINYVLFAGQKRKIPADLRTSGQQSLQEHIRA